MGLREVRVQVRPPRLEIRKSAPTSPLETTLMEWLLRFRLDDHTLRDTFIRDTLHSLHRALLALMLRRVNGSDMEVLVDAETTLQHLAASFGSADAAVGQKVELSLDVFGFFG